MVSERGVMNTYGNVLRWVYIKKAIISSIVDYIQSLSLPTR